MKVIRRFALTTLILATLLCVAWGLRVKLLNWLLPELSRRYTQINLDGTITMLDFRQATLSQLSFPDYQLEFKNLNINYALWPSKSDALIINAIKSKYSNTSISLTCTDCELVTDKNQLTWSPFAINAATLTLPQVKLNVGTILETNLSGVISGSISAQSINLILQGSSPLFGKLSGKYNKVADQQKYELNSYLKLNRSSPLTKSYLPGLAATAGTLDLKLVGTNNFVAVSAVGNSLNISAEKVQVEGAKIKLNGRIELQPVKQVSQQPDFTFEVSVPAIQALLPVKNLIATGGIRPSSGGIQLSVKTFHAQLLGGSIEIDAFLTSVPITKCQQVNFKLEKIDLVDLLELYKQKNINATGQISATIPVQICPDKWQIISSNLSAIGPGRIQISQDASFGNTTADVAMQALKDFAYSTLSAGLSVQADGNANLAVKLAGISHSLNKRTPIVVNLNVSDNVFALMQSLYIAENLSDRVEQKFKPR